MKQLALAGVLVAALAFYAAWQCRVDRLPKTLPASSPAELERAIDKQREWEKAWLKARGLTTWPSPSTTPAVESIDDE